MTTRRTVAARARRHGLHEAANGTALIPPPRGGLLFDTDRSRPGEFLGPADGHWTLRCPDTGEQWRAAPQDLVPLGAGRPTG
ncbi:hypothetical protein [Streptomyces sp. NPDC002490]|uniref:hypothetical protein n=1 Tax=Streptomyces sp. NPDC002490 TaxID=3154416 RepID=UPI0033239394